MKHDPVLVAYVVLKGPGHGSGEKDEPITSANVRQFVPDPGAGTKAKQQLARMGFLVRRASPFTLRVEAPSARFEQAFNARVAVGERDSSSSVGEEPHWREPPRLPAGLSGIVEDVVFPREVAHHAAVAMVSPDI